MRENKATREILGRWTAFSHLARAAFAAPFALAALTGCHEKIAAPPAAPLEVKPMVQAPPASPPPLRTETKAAEDLDGIPTEGPFQTLALYCKWFKGDCAPHDARLCRCEVQSAGADLAVVRTRDLGEANSYGMVTDASAIRPAFRRADGWRVARFAPEFRDQGAETSGGGVRSNVRLESAASEDLLGDDAPELAFVFRSVREEMPPGATTWSVSATELSFVVCGSAQGGYCTTPIAWDPAAGKVPMLTKSPSGWLVAGDKAYRLVVAPRMP